MVVSSDAAKEAEVGFQDCVSFCPTRQPHSKFQDVYQSTLSLSRGDESSTCRFQCCVAFSVLLALWLRALALGSSHRNASVLSDLS